MGIWDTLTQHAKAQFLDVIEWTDDTRDTIVYRFPVFGKAIQDGGKLVVREGQAALFVSEGRLSESFGPGTYELSTRTPAIWGFFQTIQYGLDYPYKGDVYFVNTRQFMGQKWGTPNPILARDADFGAVRIRAFGVFGYRIADAATFLREVVGTAGLTVTEEINGVLKKKLVSIFADSIGEAKIPVLDLVAHYADIGEAMKDRVSAGLQAQLGVAITDFTIESISVPEEVEKAIDRRSAMGAIGNMNTYTQFQAANAIEAAASSGGGGNNPMLDAGMGLAMGQVVGGAFARSAAPPPPPTEARLHYNGPSGQAELTAREIAARVVGARGGAHLVWATGWPSWRNAMEIPDIAALVPPAPPAPPPIGGASQWHYAGDDGVPVVIASSDVAARVRAAPAARHLVWKDGMPSWVHPREVPELAPLLSGPPPLPGAGGPPPIPGGPPPVPR